MAKILLVDDELVTLQYLKELLRHIGHDVAGTAKSGPMAVKTARETKPDLVLMDIYMPGEYNGIEAARIIEAELDIPVVFLTAFETKQYIDDIKRIGPFGYIIKPTKRSEIEAAIHIALYRDEMERKLKRSIEGYRRELDYKKIIHDFLSEINTEVDPYEKLCGLLRHIIKRMGLDGVFIYRLDRAAGQLKKEVCVRSDAESSTLPETAPLSGLKGVGLDNLKRAYLVDDLSVLPAAVRNAFKKNDIHSIFAAPLIIERSVFGFIGFGSVKTRKFFSIDRRRFLRILAKAVAILIKRHLDFLKIKEIEREKRLKENVITEMERLASLGQLSSAIGHEINQPLHSIKILADSVIYWDKQEKRLPYEDVINNLHKISSRVGRIDSIIKTMRLMVKSPEKIEVKAVDLNAVVHETLDLFPQKLVSHGIDFSYTPGEDLPQIVGSDIQVQQVIINLMDNAIKALDDTKKKKKTITIRTAAAGEVILLQIIDNGPGISDREKEKVFDPFYSLQTKKGGMGMGLYIVQNIIKTFNAHIHIEDNPDGGAVFTVQFKCYDNY